MGESHIINKNAQNLDFSAYKLKNLDLIPHFFKRGGGHKQISLIIEGNRGANIPTSGVGGWGRAILSTTNFQNLKFSLHKSKHLDQILLFLDGEEWGGEGVKTGKLVDRG